MVSVVIVFIVISCARQKIDMHQVTVTILPQKYFVDRLGGGKFKVNVIIPAGQDPHTYELTPGQMGDVGRSSVYFMIGYFPYELIYCLLHCCRHFPDKVRFAVSFVGSRNDATDSDALIKD